MGKLKSHMYHTSITKPGPEAIQLFSCSTQLSMNISLQISMKMPTIVGIFIFISRETFMLSYVKKKQFAILRNLIFISGTNFMLSWSEHENFFFL